MESNVSPVRAFFRNKWVRLILVIDVLVLVAMVVIMVINAMKTAVINISVTPLDAVVMVDGHEYENGWSYRLMPGEHEVAISHEGFVTKTFNVEIGSDEIANMTTYLVGEGEFEASTAGVNDPRFEWYKLKDNYGSFTRLAEMATPGNNITYDQDVRAGEFVEEVQKALGLMGELPIIRQISHYFPETGVKHIDKITIMNGTKYDDGENCKTYLCLCIEYYDDGVVDNYYDLAVDKVLEAGYDVEDYEVIIVGQQ